MQKIEELQHAVERLHECTAEFVGTEHVDEVFQGKVIWSGEVATFTLTDHPTATTAYAWKEVNPETGRDRFFAVLKLPPVDSPHTALRASIVADYRATES